MLYRSDAAQNCDLREWGSHCFDGVRLRDVQIAQIKATINIRDA
jgi:hypothetical protein